jgi:5-methylcytosine-specific restriction enzyme A
VSRKQFVESHGATCVNWTWSWSFVNHKVRFVIFGAWDVAEDGNKTMILEQSWALSRRGRRQPAYSHAIEHLRLVEEEGYALKTFRIVHSSADELDEYAPAKIDDFVPILKERELIRIGTGWYACDKDLGTALPEEVEVGRTYVEGSVTTVQINQYERNRAARDACLAHHGRKCCVCSFDFSMTYGALGKGYIHVHHLVPISDIGREYTLDPTADLVPICPNCHAMVHSTKPPLTIEQLRGVISAARNVA